MGRTAGATAADTRERLLRAAADVFGARGYDGTRVSDIAAAAGLSNGAMYAYFASKAELLVGAVRAHGRRLLTDLLAADPSRSIAEVLLETGRSLRRRPEPEGYLVIEALVAARRDEALAGSVRPYVRERADWLAALVREAQARGELDPAVSPDAVAHFCVALAMGSALVPPDLHDVGDDEWAALLARLVAALAPNHSGPPLRSTQRRATDRSCHVRLRIDPERCQGHGRCYDLAPDLFGEDEDGYGTVLGNGAVPPDREGDAELAIANCPEQAIGALEEAAR